MTDTIQSPLAATDDAFKASRLERMLSNFTASYKIYFLEAIFNTAISGKLSVTYNQLAAKMVASAWYPVLFFRLNLGATDQLTQVVDMAHERLALDRSASQDDIVTAILSTEDRTITRQLRDLCKYVPYRLLRVFYGDRFAEERAATGPIKDARVNGLISQFNREDPAGALYILEYDGSGITVDPEWAQYFRDNLHVVRGWLDMRLVDYLQRRNPSVPAIPLKIHPPLRRDLTEARRWWKDALRRRQLREVYTGTPFGQDTFHDRGPLSIDHFIPWSFVLHDEPWNLLPTFRNTNSAKGDRLPDLNKYLPVFCTQQFDALITLRNHREHRKIVDAYALVDPHIREYEQTDQSLSKFTATITRVITPLHQIAANQGFPMWLGMNAQKQ